MTTNGRPAAGAPLATPTTGSDAGWRAGTVGAVRRFVSLAGGPRCGLCGARIDRDHGHAVSQDLDLACVCRPCHLTLANPTGRWVATDPDGAPRLVSGSTPPTPVGLAIVTPTATGPVVRYPAPAGMQVVDEDDAWADVLTIGRVRPLVESVVVVGGRVADVPVCLCVPTDQAMALQGDAARAWTGLDGGPQVLAVVRDRVDRWLAQAVP